MKSIQIELRRQAVRERGNPRPQRRLPSSTCPVSRFAAACLRGSLFLLILLTASRLAVAAPVARSDGQTPEFWRLSSAPGQVEVLLDYRGLRQDVSHESDLPVRVSVESFARNDASGQPDLPTGLLWLQLPYNTRNASLRVEVSVLEQSDVGSGLRVAPVPYPKPAASNPTGMSSREEGAVGWRDEAVYTRDAAYPLSAVQSSSPYRLGSQAFVCLRVWPFLYNPVTGTLTQIHLARVKIGYELDPDSRGVAAHRFSPTLTAAMPSASPSAGLSADEQPNGYAIITTNAAVATSQRLADFIRCKERCGFVVRLVTEDDYGILAGAPPHGTAEKVREWLIQNYEAMALKYVLLIGDPTPADPEHPEIPAGDLPMKMLFPRAGDGWYWDDYNSPSDWIYANLTGNWDLDGDGLFGEASAYRAPSSPDPQMDPGAFSIRWTGKVSVTDPAGMSLAVYCGGGFRVWIDDLSGPPAIDQWRNAISGHGRCDIAAPGLHDIRIEYFQDHTNAFFRLLSGAYGAGWYFDIDASHLYSWDGQAWVPGGLAGEYFRDTALSDPVLTRIDPVPPRTSFSLSYMAGDNGTGGVDFTPDVIVGRIPVYEQDYARLDTILEKIIRYEFEPDRAWRRRVLLPMKPFDQSTPNYDLGELVRTYLCMPNGFGTYRIYDENYDCETPPERIPCTPENVLASWQNPFGLVTWSTHGSARSAASIFDSELCGSLSESRPAMVYAGSCDNGYPEDPENLGYSLLAHGAIGTVSASRVSFYLVGVMTAPPNSRDIRGIGYLCSKYLMEGSTIGEAVAMARNLPPGESSDIWWMNAFDYNLYGDPSLSLAGHAFHDVEFARGDVDASGELNISDPIYNLAYQFAGGPEPPCEDAADDDDSGEVNISDPIYSLQYQFAGGPPLPAPFGSCGWDSTAERLGCDQFAPCEGKAQLALQATKVVDGSKRLLLEAVPGTSADTLCLKVTVVTDVPLAGLEQTTGFDPSRLQFVRLDKSGISPRMDFLSARGQADPPRVRLGGVPDFGLAGGLAPGTHEIGRLVFARRGEPASGRRAVWPIEGRFVGKDLRAYRIEGGASVDPTIASVPEGEPAAGRAMVFPNPYHPNGPIRLRLDPTGGEGDVAVYDVQGRRIKTLYSGPWTTVALRLAWNGRSDCGAEVAAGLYYLRARTRLHREARSLLLLR